MFMLRSLQEIALYLVTVRYSRIIVHNTNGQQFDTGNHTIMHFIPQFIKQVLIEQPKLFVLDIIQEVNHV